MDSAKIRTVIARQLLASLSTLKAAIDSCPEDQLHERHGDYPFSQVAFHALFYCDFYLSASDEEFFSQEFHVSRRDVFDDYEELEYRPAVKTYAAGFLSEYVEHCRTKIEATLRDIADAELESPAAVKTNGITRMELFVDTLRHTQHHAAQLGLRVQLLTGKELGWVESGWKQLS